MDKTEVKKLARLVAFSFIFFYLFVHVCYLFRPTIYFRFGIAGYYEERENTLDVVYVGGSACFDYWAPMEAWKQNGIPSYAYGYNSMTVETVIPTIKEVLKTQNPSLLIVDVKPYEYRDDDERAVTDAVIRNFTDQIPYSLERSRFISHMDLNEIEKPDNRIDYYLDISKYHGNWGLLSEDSFELADNKKKHINKGTYLNQNTEVIVDTDFTNILEEKEPSSYVKAEFAKLMDYLETKDVEVLFVVNVYSELEEDRERYNYLKKEIEKNGYDFINCNDYDKAMNIDFNSDFYNSNHTNVFGVEKYSLFLSDYIANKYELTDRRNQKEYDEWNKNILEWNNILDSKKQEALKLRK